MKSNPGNLCFIKDINQPYGSPILISLIIHGTVVFISKSGRNREDTHQNKDNTHNNSPFPVWCCFTATVLHIPALSNQLAPQVDEC